MRRTVTWKTAWITVVVVAGLGALAPGRAEAQEAEAAEAVLVPPPVDAAAQTEAAAPDSALPAPATTAPSSAAPETAPAEGPRVSLHGWVESYYQWNFAQPANGVTNFRGFDNRHNSLTLNNVVLDAAASYRGTQARIALQVGQMPATYYASEPVEAPTSGAAGTGPVPWQYLQQAWVGYRLGPAERLQVTMGLFTSPLGPESMAIRENWNWSHSNLFVGLPFYHAGARASYRASDEVEVTAAVFNGWNNVVDNNPEKTVSLQVTWKQPGRFDFNAVYLGGVERDVGAPEGRGFRHAFDVSGVVTLSPRLEALFELDAGFEPNALGVSSWFAAQGAVRFVVTPAVRLAARADLVTENAPGGASPILFPSPMVGAGTVTLEYRPVDAFLVRLEGRHDRSAAPLYFAGSAAAPSTSQSTTLTLGATAWF